MRGVWETSNFYSFYCIVVYTVPAHDTKATIATRYTKYNVVRANMVRATEPVPISNFVYIVAIVAFVLTIADLYKKIQS
jgi:hypothetical protein